MQRALLLTYRFYSFSIQIICTVATLVGQRKGAYELPKMLGFLNMKLPLFRFCGRLRQFAAVLRAICGGFAGKSGTKYFSKRGTVRNVDTSGS